MSMFGRRKKLKKSAAFGRIAVIMEVLSTFEFYTWRGDKGTFLLSLCLPKTLSPRMASAFFVRA
jgi:hypothetical protein